MPISQEAANATGPLRTSLIDLTAAVGFETASRKYFGVPCGLVANVAAMGSLQMSPKCVTPCPGTGGLTKAFG
jgi:hypothetical protein